MPRNHLDAWEKLVHTVEDTCNHWQDSVVLGHLSYEEWWGVIKEWCHWGKLQGTWWATEVGKSMEIPGVSPFLPHTPSSSGPFLLFPLPWPSHYRPVQSLLQRGSFLPSYLLLPLYFISTVNFNSTTTAYWTLPPWLLLCPLIAQSQSIVYL